MNNVSIDLQEDVKIDNSMLILGFPTVGLVGSIAGSYIADSLNMSRIGSIHSKHFMPSVIIHDSKPMPPVRIYHAGSDICKKNDICDNLLTIVSEFPVPPSAAYKLINEINDFAEKHNTSLILGLEGMKSLDHEEDQVDVYGVGSTSNMVEILDNYNIEKTKEGMISGFTGALLCSQTEKNKDMLCMLTAAHSAYPDSRAAGRLLEKVDSMLPGVELDLGPLYEKAEKLEEQIKKYMKQSKQAPQAQQKVIPNMYR